jgi:hypothetical protein
MKKMLTLVVILLSIASLASASTIAAYNAGTNVISVTVTNNTGSEYIGLSITSGAGILSGFAKGPQAPASTDNFANLGVAGYYQGYGEGELWTCVDTAGVPTYIDGSWLTANFSGAKPSTVTLWAYDENTEGFTAIQTILIPEPATIALLCLGGLLLRKKK